MTVSHASVGDVCFKITSLDVPIVAVEAELRSPGSSGIASLQAKTDDSADLRALAEYLLLAASNLDDAKARADADELARLRDCDFFDEGDYF